MKVSKFACSFVILLLASTCLAQTYTTFDVPGSNGTIAVAINLGGKVTGYYFGVPEEELEYPQSFVRQPNGTITTFGLHFGEFITGTQANDINLFGEIVGTYWNGGETSMFVRKPDGTIDGKSEDTVSALNGPVRDPIGCPGVDGNVPVAVNAIGQITGSYGQGCLLGFLRQPDGTGISFQAGDGFITEQSTVPQAINLVGQIVGYYYDRTSSGSFLRQSDGTIVRFNVPGSAQTFAYGINLFGQVVGTYDGHGFLRQPNGTFIKIDPPGSKITQVSAINDLGQITGFFATSNGVYHGFVRRANGRIETFDPPNATGTFPRDINDLGQIVGFYQDANFATHGFIRDAR